ncbi:hypothetical protein EV1_038067 [Malus domestica]
MKFLMGLNEAYTVDSSIMLSYTQASFYDDTSLPHSTTDPPSSGTNDTFEAPSSPHSSIAPTSPMSSALPPTTPFSPDVPNPSSHPTRGTQVLGYLIEYHVGVSLLSRTMLLFVFFWPSPLPNIGIFINLM